MDRKVNLDILPFEVLGHIGSYLGVEDLLACCATSTFMRQAFSDDLIWKKYCDLKLVDYLKQNESVVEASLEWVELEEQINLSPVPIWRKCYMMQTRLFNNWRQGKYEKEQIECDEDSAILDNPFTTFYGDEHLYIHTESFPGNKTLGEIWSVKDSPVKEFVVTSNFMFHDFNNFVGIRKKYYLVKNKLVGIQYNLVLIYDLKLSPVASFSLCHAFLFDNSERISIDFISCKQKSVHSQMKLTIKCDVSGNFVIALMETSNCERSVSFHIWDIQTGNKMKEEIISSNNIVESGSFLKCENGKDIIISLRMSKDRYMYHCLGYDLSKLACSPFLLKLNYCDFQVFTGNYVIGICQQRLYIYCYKSSNRLLVKHCSQFILQNSITVLGNHLLFATFANIIHVIDLLTLEIINSVQPGFTLYSLRGICNRFVVINSADCEVWEIGRTAKKLFMFPCDSAFAAIHPCHSKLVVERKNKYIILNFW